MPPQAPDEAAADAIPGALFALSVDGAALGPFEAVLEIWTGLDPDAFSLTPDPRRKPALKRLPGKRTPPHLTVRRHQSKDQSIFDWHRDAVNGRPGTRRRLTLTILDGLERPALLYHFHAAWPAKIELTPFSTSSPGMLYETVTFVCTDVERARP